MDVADVGMGYSGDLPQGELGRKRQRQRQQQAEHHRRLSHVVSVPSKATTAATASSRRRRSSTSAVRRSLFGSAGEVASAAKVTPTVQSPPPPPTRVSRLRRPSPKLVPARRSPAPRVAVRVSRAERMRARMLQDGDDEEEEQQQEEETPKQRRRASQKSKSSQKRRKSSVKAKKKKHRKKKRAEGADGGTLVVVAGEGASPTRGKRARAPVTEVEKLQALISHSDWATSVPVDELVSVPIAVLEGKEEEVVEEEEVVRVEEEEEQEAVVLTIPLLDLTGGANENTRRTPHRVPASARLSALSKSPHDLGRKQAASESAAVPGASQSAQTARNGNEFDGMLDRIEHVMEQRKTSADSYIGYELKDEAYKPGVLTSGRMAFFRYHLHTSDVQTNCTVRFELEVMRGAVDVFVSSSSKYPQPPMHNAKRKRRGEGGDGGEGDDAGGAAAAGNAGGDAAGAAQASDANDGADLASSGIHWSAQNVRGPKLLAILPKDPNYRAGYYYLTVRARGKAQFMLRASTLGEVRTSRQRSKNSTAVPSRKVLQRRLDARLKELRTDPIAAARLQANAARIRQQLFGPTGHAQRDIVVRNLDTTKYFPEELEAERQRRADDHNEHIDAVLSAKARADKEQLKRTMKRLKFKEAHHKALALKRKKRQAMQSKQKVQLMWADVLVVHLRMGGVWQRTLRRSREQRELDIKRNEAARTIQRAVNAFLVTRRRRRTRLHVQVLRTAVRMFVSNHQLVRRHRAADAMRAFFTQYVLGHDPVQRLLDRFRRRVAVIQRVCRDRLAIRQARLSCWSLHWDRIFLEMREREPTLPLVPPEIKRKVIVSHMDDLQRHKRKEVERYQHEMQRYRHKLRCEQARKLVFRSDGGGGKHVEIKAIPPQRPRVRAVLPSSEMTGLIREGVRLAASEG